MSSTLQMESPVSMAVSPWMVRFTLFPLEVPMQVESSRKVNSLSSMYMAAQTSVSGSQPAVAPSLGPQWLCPKTHTHTQCWQHLGCWPAPLQAGPRASLTWENQRELSEVVLTHQQPQVKLQARKGLSLMGTLQLYLSVILFF